MIRKRVRYVELNGVMYLHLGDAVDADLILAFSAKVRFVEDAHGEVYVRQEDLLDLGVLKDYIGVEVTE